MTQLAHILKRRRRGSIGLEAVLALPVVLLIGGIIAQTMLLAQNRLYVEQAAYAAARSALVHMCPTFDLTCRQTKKAPWEDAARWTLVAAAPSSGFAKARGNCGNLPAGVELMKTAKLNGRLTTALENRICYVTERGNVSVEIERPIRAGVRTIRATVYFKSALTTPIQKLLSEGKHADGTPWRMLSATVEIL